MIGTLTLGDMMENPEVDNASTPVDAQTIANEFTRILKDWLTVEEWDAMCALNGTEAYGHGACASHNYCDANEAMMEAFAKHHVEYPSDDFPDSIALWNEAWELARATWQPWGPALPWQLTFRKFDYDYTALIAELGPDWVDGSWGNDSCPSADWIKDSHLGVKIFFDYADRNLSQDPEAREGLAMMRYSIGDMSGTYAQFEDWADMLAYAKAFNPPALRMWGSAVHNCPIAEVREFAEDNPGVDVWVFSDGDDYAWAYEFEKDGKHRYSVIEGNHEITFDTVDELRLYLQQMVAENQHAEWCIAHPRMQTFTVAYEYHLKDSHQAIWLNGDTLLRLPVWNIADAKRQIAETLVEEYNDHRDDDENEATIEDFEIGILIAFKGEPDQAVEGE